jgi:hypothetical protein
MNELGLQYRLQCRLINKDLWDDSIARCVVSAEVFRAAASL